MKYVTLTLLLAVTIGIGFLIWSKEGGTPFGAAYDMNYIQGWNSRSTSTAIAGTGYCSGQCAPLLLSPSEYNSFVYFKNYGNTEVTLIATSTPLDRTGTGAEKTATTSLAVRQGIVLGAFNTASSTYQITSDNFIKGYWYATTSPETTAQTIVTLFR